MSFFTACGLSLLRAEIVAVVGVLIASRLQRTMRVVTGFSRSLLWSLVLLPVFVPGLLIGYGYRNFSLSLVQHPVWNELVYGVLVLLMVVPVGTLILVCSPAPPISPSGLHVARLMRFRTPATRLFKTAGVLSLWIRSRLYALVPAMAAMFLLTFQETEVATLMQADGWPEWTFTRLAGGLPVQEALTRLFWPITIQVGVIVVALKVVLTGSLDRSTTAAAINRAASPVAAWTFAVAAIGGLLVVPGAVVLQGSMQGFSVLAAHPVLMRQIGIGLLFGATAGLLAWVLSGALVERLHRGRGLLLASFILLPGLMGAWALGLALAGLFQTSWLRPVYSTPLPMILGEVLFQLPRAVIVRLLLGRLRDSTAAHSASLLTLAPNAIRRRRGADLLWLLDTRGRVLGGMIVCYWSYMELSIPSPALLGPPGMTSAPVLLYNQMHYGQIPGLSALLLATLTVPVVCLIVASALAQSVASR